MKKACHLLGVALLGAIALASCEEDKIVNENTGGGSEAGRELADYTFTASIKQPEALVRANVQHEGYVWNSGDAVTVWNRNLGTGYGFTIASDFQSGKEAVFTGKAAMTNGHKLIAVFPRMEKQAFSELATVEMPDVCEQSAGTAELGTTTYMIATGNVSDNKIPALTFSPLTALLQFNLKNTSGGELKMGAITIESDDEIFPRKAAFGDDGEVTALLNTKSKVTLDMKEQTLANGMVLNGYLNILPTTYGDIRLMGANTRLTITIKVWSENGAHDIVLLKEVAVKDLQEKLGLDMEISANQFAAGRKYVMDFDVDYHFKIPEEGYLIDDDGNIHIYNANGLVAWSLLEQENVTVTLEKDYIENHVIDLDGKEWTPISAFYGLFEGNDVVIKNLKLSQGGFIAANNGGTIQNLTFKDVSYSQDITSDAGGLVVSNAGGKIKNCTIDGITLKATKAANVGGLVGTNTYPGIIENCRVLSGTFDFSLSGSGNGNYGGLVGYNYGGTALILNSFVGAIKVSHPTNSAGASCVGGLLGFNSVGKVMGCYSLAEMTINCSAQAGGLIGVNANGTALASYAAGTISGGVSNNTGGLIGFNNGGTTIVTACYATTQLSATASNIGKFGAFIGTNNGNAAECYFINETMNNATGNNSSKGITKVTAESLRSKVRYLNLAIEEAEPGFGFNFKVNEDAGTNTLQPLVLQPAVSVPGFGGSDFGDGGDI